MGEGALIVEPVGESKVLGMIGDGHVLVAIRPGRLRHLFYCVSAIGLDGVHMHVALKIGGSDELRKLVCGGKIDLAQVFAHLGRDVVQV